MNDNKRFLVISLVLGIMAFAASLFFKSNSEVEKVRPAKVAESILVKPHSFVKGSSTAPVTIVEFLDPECESCRQMHPIMKQLLSEYDGKIKLIIRYMPLHKNSLFAAAALEEAREHGKFEETLDILFENQPTWGSHHDPRPDLIPVYLETIGISKDTLNVENLLSKYQAKIEIDRNDGVAAGVKGTPTFFVNGIPLERIGHEAVKNAIDKALKELK